MSHEAIPPSLAFIELNHVIGQRHTGAIVPVLVNLSNVTDISGNEGGALINKAGKEGSSSIAVTESLSDIKNALKRAGITVVEVSKSRRAPTTP